MKRRLVIFLVSVLSSVSVWAGSSYGMDSVSSEWFREWYQWNELRHYLDNGCPVTTYQLETTGDWGAPEPLLFSINGNSYRWNKYYLRHFRVDSRIEAGDALYTPDLFVHSMQIDPNRGAVYWQPDSVAPNQIRLSGQGGNVGGYSLSAKWLQELQEGNSAIKRLKNDLPLQFRRHTVGAGNVDARYAIPVKGRNYQQHMYGAYGMRRQLRYSFDGIVGTYDADYYHAQLDGQLPVSPNKAFDALYYILRAGYHADGYSELGYNDNEVAYQLNHSFSFYGTKDWGRRGQLTTGLTYALQRNIHRDLEFSRNTIDVDGEAFEPWYPDGHTHELNWAVDYRYAITPWLKVHLDSYNSLLAFTPLRYDWANEVYLQGDQMTPLQLYDYQWHSSAFCAGMLENTFSLEAGYAVLPWLHLSGSVSATLDGMLVRGKNVVTPSWEAKADIHIEPARWFKMDIIAANYRIPYTYEQIRFLSDDYMNGEVYYAGTNTLLTTTGGQYHRPGKGLWQPQYVAVDVPIVFTIGRHEIRILSAFKKYYHTWSVQLADESKDSYTPITVNQEAAANLPYTIYAMQPQARYYEVVPAPKTGSGIWDSPVFASNLIQYTYNGRKVYVSFSWQSYCVSGTSALGNGAQTEDIQVLSESLASPNNSLVNANMQQPDEGIRSLGRLHQDRAYIARLQLGVNITQNWQLSLTGRFRDGIPFRPYRTYLYVDAAGHHQAVVWNAQTRGINVADGHFGERTDSFFNFDLRLKYRGQIKGVPFAAQIVCYNIWDFATELNEYCMYYDAQTSKGISSHRYPLSLCTPRGLSMNVQIGL